VGGFVAASKAPAMRQVVRELRDNKVILSDPETEDGTRRYVATFVHPVAWGESARLTKRRYPTPSVAHSGLCW
jgi:hypothetical protein